MELDRIAQRINRSLGQRVKAAERDISKRFARVLLEIRAEMAKAYERYEQGGKLTYEEMVRYDRLTRFMEEVEGLLDRNHKAVVGVIRDALGEVYRDGFYLFAWAVETETASRLNYSIVTPDNIKKALENPVSGLTLSERLEKYRTEILYDIRQTITQGLVQGEPFGAMAKRLQASLDNDLVKATRIIRTEAHRVTEAGKHDSARHANSHGIIMMKKWRNSKDERVRSSHRSLNGVTIPVEENFTGRYGSGPAPGQLGHPREDINCRCFLVHTVERIEKPDANELTDMTFERWKKERLRR